MRWLASIPFAALKSGFPSRRLEELDDTRDRLLAKLVDFTRCKTQFERAGLQPRELSSPLFHDAGDLGHEQGLRRVDILRPIPVLRWICDWDKHHFDTPYVQALPPRTPYLVVKSDKRGQNSKNDSGWHQQIVGGCGGRPELRGGYHRKTPISLDDANMRVLLVIDTPALTLLSKSSDLIP
jgi:hypothetical protein